MILFGIFNLKSIENTKEYNYLYDNLNNQNKLEDVSGDRKKSFINKGVLKDIFLT